MIRTVRTRLSNARYRATRPLRTAGGSYRNWVNRRAITRGRSPLPERLTRRLRSSTPVYRRRINPGTGRPRRDDRELGQAMDRSLAARAGRPRQPRPRQGRPARPGRSR